MHPAHPPASRATPGGDRVEAVRLPHPNHDANPNPGPGDPGSPSPSPYPHWREVFKSPEIRRAIAFDAVSDHQNFVTWCKRAPIRREPIRTLTCPHLYRTLTLTRTLTAPSAAPSSPILLPLSPPPSPSLT